VIYDTPASNGLITVNFDQNLAPNVTLVGSYVTGNLNVSMTAYDSDNNIINSIATGGANSAPNGTPNKLLEIMSDRPIRKITFFNGGERGNTFTIDNFYFDSGLNCQISNVPLYKQSGDVDWAEDLYGGSEANPWFDDKGKPGKIYEAYLSVISVDQASHTLPTATPTVLTATPTVPTATPTVPTATPTVPTATPTVPTATPTSTLVASAVLLNTTPSNECEWQVDMQLKGFTPNSQITVSSNYTELVCMTGEIRSDSWSGLYHSNTDANGDLIVSYLHGGTGSYTYSFVDSMGKSASVSFNTSSEIAFVSERDGNAEIYTMRIDGTELSRLTTNSFIDYNPTWSPNGSKIAFHSNRSGKNQIYTMDANGANQIRLLQSTASDEWPYWSPDGAQIAFGRVDALDNGGERTEVFVVNSDGTNPTRLTFTTGQTGDSLHGCWPSGWAPNSSEILYYCSLNGNNLSWIMNANGTNQHKLIDGANWNAIPSMSPDGLIISFSTFRDNNYEIYTVNRDGSNLIRLTTIDAEDWRPNWSNNSRFIIFESKREGETQVFMMNRDGSRQRRISSTNDAYNGQPVWRPTN